MSALVIQAEVVDRGVRVDLEVAGGEVVALLGPNGPGKSTVVSLAAGILRPSAGSVWLDGREVAGSRWVPPHQRHISLLAQEPLLLPHLDVVANVAFGPRALGRGRAASHDIAMARLAEVGATNLADRRPRELSGGQQQRVALARALAPDPQLLLLDEPLAALDVDAAAQLRQVLRDSLRAARRTAVIVTHDLLDVLALADRIVVLEDGHIVEDGPTMGVLDRPRSEFGARFAGVNLLVGTQIGPGVVRDTAGVVLHGLAEQGSGPGDRVAAAFSPRAVAVHRAEPGGSPRNAVQVQIAGIEQQGELVRVRGRTGSGTKLSADITPASIASLGLEIGQDVTFVVKAAEVAIYPA